MTSAWPNLEKLHYCPFSTISNHLLLQLQQLSFTFWVSSNPHEELFSAIWWGGGGFFVVKIWQSFLLAPFLLSSCEFLLPDIQDTPITPYLQAAVANKYQEGVSHNVIVDQVTHELLLSSTRSLYYKKP